MGTRGKAPRSWMFESYMRDGGKEQPVPAKWLPVLRAHKEARLGKKPEAVKTVKMKTIGSNDDAD